MNTFRYVEIENSPCVEFKTKGKTEVNVIVDRHAWEVYLSSHSWTAIKDGNRATVKTSINKQSQAIWRVIVEHEFDEITWWGSTIDHKNNNPLDNRLVNLQIFNTVLLNSTNISSKFSADGMQYIQSQGKYSYKVHYNLGGQTFYKNFSRKEYGSKEAALHAAKAYRNHAVEVERPRIIAMPIKKARDVEFERGLQNKLENDERDEIDQILRKYHIE